MNERVQIYKELVQTIVRTPIQKKSAQFYNSRYNEILNYGLEGDEEA